MVVTTARFTSPARSEALKVSEELTLVDRDTLGLWLSDFACRGKATAPQARARLGSRRGGTRGNPQQLSLDLVDEHGRDTVRDTKMSETQLT
jgi:hypothetical protein